MGRSTAGSRGRGSPVHNRGRARPGVNLLASVGSAIVAGAALWLGERLVRYRRLAASGRSSAWMAAPAACSRSPGMRPPA